MQLPGPCALSVWSQEPTGTGPVRLGKALPVLARGHRKGRMEKWEEECSDGIKAPRSYPVSPVLGCRFIPSDVAKQISASLPPAAPSVMLLATPPPETSSGDSKNFPTRVLRVPVCSNHSCESGPTFVSSPSEAAVV